MPELKRHNTVSFTPDVLAETERNKDFNTSSISNAAKTKLDEQTRESILKALTAYANQLYTTMGNCVILSKANSIS